MELKIAVMLLGLSIFMNACIQVAPNLKLPEPKDFPKEAKPTASVACPKLEMPPIPKNVTIKITPDQVKADEGGTQLLKSYVQARGLLR